MYLEKQEDYIAGVSMLQTVLLLLAAYPMPPHPLVTAQHCSFSYTNEFQEAPGIPGRLRVALDHGQFCVNQHEKACGA
ncbi:hypothetical protein M514_15943 [Trichuris suis]|uniref:Uncharacterized protein n=1 Tax=Trichuris suis TaxID=68888 RepID=A0A085NQT7_9BILA|nr:hypothetical protein M514_15943 [Trichuris suis]